MGNNQATSPEDDVIEVEVQSLHSYIAAEAENDLRKQQEGEEPLPTRRLESILDIFSDVEPDDGAQSSDASRLIRNGATLQPSATDSEAQPLEASSITGAILST
ncbi:MAG: hypothetical protein LQ342_008450 [Letrouitia transgressa]|nr:MAG: hypothetical protein LQ342_008450 [Letrouitia transgressa]